MELDQYHRPMLHSGALALNCGRNCLAYLLRARNITQLALPYLLCNSIRDICSLYHVKLRFYHITEDFCPEDIELKPDEWMYVVNYYGQLDEKALYELLKKYPRLIIDQTQAYFMAPLAGADNIYTCRKFLGVPDGAFLYTDTQLNADLPVDESFMRMAHLLGRFEKNAAEFYQEYRENERIFCSEPIKQMSRLTNNLLHGIDYSDVKARRSNNFLYLKSNLSKINRLNLREIEGAFAYPLLLPNAITVRQELIAQQIYIPILWPEVLTQVSQNAIEYDYANNILPLPCDQRYTPDDLTRILDIIFSM